ncbi:MAG: selenocysteine-specific translation elongation factor [Stomatobaculum sp.]|nr:selenocysteine-specific translation elongation factor [Stomatobaculum sp.]
MHNVIIGTAGHVDHGKTCLIKALTGVDTDRLQEEKKRGITIELGFASLPNEEGLRIGIIDVPGHEKFVKNMLAGIGGIDLVLLIIALDEGVMPQTREHFEILRMLRIRKGILVFTKADLVEEDWAVMVEEDAREMVKGSFLEDAPSVRVSAYTGQNVDLLKKMILEEVRDTASRRSAPELFRLPVDRVFTMEGFGTVVTGTLTEGSCETGGEIMIYPAEKTVRIRGLQNHNEAETRAEAGQRTALNLPIPKEELQRGDVLAAPRGLIPGMMADAKIQLFADTKRKLKNNALVHVSFGAAQKIAKTVLLDRDELTAGEEAYAQFRFEEPVVMKHGDRFIVRFYSPVETFGGGVFLEPAAVKHRRKRPDVIEGLRIRETGSAEERAEEEVRAFSGSFPKRREIAVRLNLSDAETEEVLEGLKKKKKVLSLGPERYLHQMYWKKVAGWAEKTVGEFHRRNPILRGMEREELKTRLGQAFGADAAVQELLLTELLKRKVLISDGSAAALDGFASSYEGELLRMKAEIEEIYRAAGVNVPVNDDLYARFKDKKQVKQILGDLARQGILIKVNQNYYMERGAWDRALQVLKDRIAAEGQITLAEFRDLLNTSRKYSQMLLEAYDEKKYTKMEGEARIAYRL